MYLYVHYMVKLKIIHVHCTCTVHAYVIEVLLNTVIVTLTSCVTCNTRNISM